MSDTPKGGYEYDLKMAEDAMVAAGHPETALEMRRHTEAIRNYMQGVLVPMFVELTERSVGTQLRQHEDANTLLLAGIQNNLQLFNTTLAEVLQTAKQALTVAEAGAARLGKLERDTKELKQGQLRISKEVNDLRSVTVAQDQQIKVIIERLDHKRQEIDEIHTWQAKYDARAAAYPEDEMKELVDYVRRKKAEEQAGDGT